MKITLEGLTADELLKIAKVLTDETAKQTKEIAEVAYIPDSKEPDVLTLDKEGLPWDERIHSSNHQMTSKGVWQRRRGVSDVEYNRIKAELQIPVAAEQPVIPEAAPAPVAPVTSVESIIPYASAPVAPAAPVESIVPQAPAAPAAPVAPAYDFVNNATAPVEPVIPQAAPVAEDPEALYNRMFEQLRNGLQMKILDANFMQNVIAGVNATYGTSYQGAAELRGNAQALSYVINELVKKGL